MKLAEAKSIIAGKPEGFMVAFEFRERGFLTGDQFPDKYAGEKLIATEKKAWELAEAFAAAAGEQYVNIYVIDSNFTPVRGYRDRILNRYGA